MFESLFRKTPTHDPEVLRAENERTNDVLHEAKTYIKEMRAPEIAEEKERRDAFMQKKLGEITGRKDEEAA